MQNPSSGSDSQSDVSTIQTTVNTSTKAAPTITPPGSSVPPPPAGFVPPPPPPGLPLPPPPPPGLGMPGIGMQGGTRPKTDLERLQDASLSVETRKELFINLVRKEKDLIVPLLQKEIELYLKLDDSKKSQEDLGVVSRKIEEVQQRLSALSRSYSKLATKSSEHEKALKNKTPDLAQIQKSVDESLVLIESVTTEIHKIFPYDSLKQSIGEPPTKTLEDLKEQLKVTEANIEDLDRSIITLKESMGQIALERSSALHPIRLARINRKEASSNKALIKAHSDLNTFKDEAARLRESISKTLSTLRWEKTKSSILAGVKSSHVDLTQRITTAKNRKEEAKVTTPKASASATKTSSSVRETAFIAFIANGLTLEAVEAPARNDILERLIGKILNIGAANLVCIRDEHPQMFSCEPYDAHRIAEEFSEKLLNYCAPPSIGGASSGLKLVTKSPLRPGLEFIEVIESLTGEDFITGQPIPEEALQQYYPAVAPLVFSKNQLFSPKNLRPPKTVNTDNANTTNNNNSGARP